MAGLFGYMDGELLLIAIIMRVEHDYTAVECGYMGVYGCGVCLYGFGLLIYGQEANGCGVWINGCEAQLYDSCVFSGQYV